MNYFTVNYYNSFPPQFSVARAKFSFFFRWISVLKLDRINFNIFLFELLL